MHRLLGVAAGVVLGASGVSYNAGPHIHMARADVTVDFPSIAPLRTEIVSVPVTGAEVGDTVLCNATASLGDTVMLGTCAVVTDGSVSIKAGNFNGEGPVDPASQAMHVSIFKTRH